MSGLQDLLLKRGTLSTVSFPRRPESIFDGVEMPVVILVSSPNGDGISSTRINRFYTRERSHAIENLSSALHRYRIDGQRIAKLGDRRQIAVASKVFAAKSVLGAIVVGQSKHEIYYQEACRYWAKATFGLPFFRRNGSNIAPPHGRVLCFESAAAAGFAACLLNSTLFYWLYSALSDCEHINDGFVRRFPIPNTWKTQDWVSIGRALTSDLDAHANRKVIKTKQGHTIEYDEINAAQSKRLIDKIDTVLARHYGFTDEELDFIINYDIKYRLGADSDEE